MSEVQTVRGFINQRLSAAAEEIFELFERTIAVYEEQLHRSKEENERHKTLLEAVYYPEVRLHRADVQQLVVSKEPPPEQQKGGQGLEQEDSEPPHIKEEKEELWSSLEGEQLHEPEEETPQSSQLHQKHNEENERHKILFEAVYYYPEVRLHRADVQQLVVSKEPPPEQQKGGQGLGQEDSEPPYIKEEKEELWSSQEGEQLHELEEETPQSSQLHQKQNEENRDSVEEPGPVSDSDPETEDNSGDTAEPETEVINAHQQTEEAHLGSNPSENGTENLSVKPFPCSQCGKQFSNNFNLKRHMGVHTGEKPFSCPVCGKGFAQSNGVRRHVKIHTRKWHSCKLCDKRFLKHKLFKLHMQTHTREKPFTGNSCNNRFTKQKPQSSQPQQKHSKENTAEPETEVSDAHTQMKKQRLGLKYSKNGKKNSKVKLFRCSLCGKQFNQNSNLKTHMRVHTGEKPFSCSVCGKGFAQKIGMQRHLSCHTGEKLYSCRFCDKRFLGSNDLRKHMRTHTGEKPRSCSLCY